MGSSHSKDSTLRDILLHPTNKQKIKEAFIAFDSDSDGTIDKAESVDLIDSLMNIFSSVMQDKQLIPAPKDAVLHGRSSEEFMDKVFSEIDTNKDGKISLKEFTDLMQNKDNLFTKTFDLHQTDAPNVELLQTLHLDTNSYVCDDNHEWTIVEVRISIQDKDQNKRAVRLEVLDNIKYGIRATEESEYIKPEGTIRLIDYIGWTIPSKALKWGKSYCFEYEKAPGDTAVIPLFTVNDEFCKKYKVSDKEKIFNVDSEKKTE
eukprot:TRINITY_DN3833_c0_g1_i1.p1 TRINITY_DN3833_c0_g1~~TRINITY_DN3833_c0_g1_i1.p1  ORF type:complete len:261 (-),score=52.44 TRINITY_DN3833_c0_g1_i1:99-881(-)